MKLVKLFSRWGSFFGGETGGFPDDVADRLVAEKRGKYELEDGSLLPWDGEEGNAPAPLDPVQAAAMAADGQSQPTADTESTSTTPTTPTSVANVAGDPAKDPFMLDGLDEPTSTALHVAGLHTPGDVEAYITSGKVLAELAGIGAARAKKISELYGVK